MIVSSSTRSASGKARANASSRLKKTLASATGATHSSAAHRATPIAALEDQPEPRIDLVSCRALLRALVPVIELQDHLRNRIELQAGGHDLELLAAIRLEARRHVVLRVDPLHAHEGLELHGAVALGEDPLEDL